MPELPEIINLARQMNQHVSGKIIANVEVLQPKCLNMPVEQFQARLQGAVLIRSFDRGKWTLTETSRGWLLINLGMGGEVILTDRDHLPDKHRIVIDFVDATCLSINFWWFGYTHFSADDPRRAHDMVSKLGPNVLDLTADDLRNRLAGRRGRIKSYLLDQSNLAGIGNAYVHDILFFARLHPDRPIQNLSADEITALYDALQRGLQAAVAKGGSPYEVDLFGAKGAFTMQDIAIGYQEGKPCPVCGTKIVKIKTGSTSSFICPQCQTL